MNSTETLNHFLAQNQKEIFKTPEIISKSINKSTSKLNESADNIIKIPTQNYEKAKHFNTPNLSEKNKLDETFHQKTPGSFIKPNPKTPTTQSANKQIAHKSYGDIFKQRIDKKKSENWPFKRSKTH